MKKLLPILSSAGLLICTATFAAPTSTTTATATSTASTTPDNTKTVSYSIGYRTGQAMKTQSIAISTTDFSKGLDDGYAGNKPMISEAVMQTALTNMQQEMMKKMQTKYTEMSEQNQKAGDAFLAKNAKEAGVKTTPSGLQYKVIDAGNGASPTATDSVTVNYEGTLINGQVFDSSYKRGKPATFKVNQVIQGWQQALQMMKPGATWMLYIPSNLAYGKQGSMGAIGPNETLIFKVNLISVNKA